MSETSALGQESALIQLLQAEFPLVPRPYDALGLRLGISASEVIERIVKLKTEGKIRQIGPVVDGRKLGYQSTLLALQIAQDKLAVAEQVIQAHAGISHAYEREHDFNIWVTLVAPPGVDIETAVSRLAVDTAATAAVSLPVLKVFKLKVHFGSDEDEMDADHPGQAPSTRMEISPRDRGLIDALQQDLPLSPTPFDGMAERLGISTDDFLARCVALNTEGIIRRYGASVNHRRVGYTANAMACWRVAPGRVDAAGAELSSKTRVSHCYERRSGKLWRHNLFAMIHGATPEDCLAIVRGATVAGELDDNLVLFSTREIKKTRIRYEAKN